MGAWTDGTAGYGVAVTITLTAAPARRPPTTVWRLGGGRAPGRARHRARPADDRHAVAGFGPAGPLLPRRRSSSATASRSGTTSGSAATTRSATAPCSRCSARRSASGPIAVLSAAASAALADVLIRRAIGRRCLPASLWFAAGTMTNVAVGRLPFALGHGRRPRRARRRPVPPADPDRACSPSRRRPRARSSAPSWP